MELTIDTASSAAGIALTREGALLAELTWQAGRGAAAELLPAIERLMQGAGVTVADLRAVFVCRGPGGYAGLRVGISTALAIAFARDADVLGYGRFEADAFPFQNAGRPVLAVHNSGRGDYAWASYAVEHDYAHGPDPSFIGPPADLLADVTDDTLVVGEVEDRLLALLEQERTGVAVVRGPAAVRRAATGAALTWTRYAAGARDSRLALMPVYLREPNITQARPRQPQAGR